MLTTPSFSAAEAAGVRFAVTTPGYRPQDVEKFHRDVVAALEAAERFAAETVAARERLTVELENSQNLVRRLTVEVELLRVSGGSVDPEVMGGNGEIPSFQPGWGLNS